jgi:hypothetical protein
MPENEKPSFNSPEWNDYVLSLFTNEELVDGNPTVDGLRRVTELVLGKIISTSVDIVQAPSMSNGNCCVLKYRINIVPDNIDIKETLSYEAAADCSSNNCDARFAVFATAVAETRAEGRVLRKALRLRKVIAAEEAVAVPHEDSLSDGRITQTQIKFIEVLSQRNDINIVKYLSAAKDFKFTGRLEDIPYKSAVTVIAHLSEMQRNNASISPKFKGFEQDWRK